MINPTIPEYLKYADLQMAAEAFVRDQITKELKNDDQLLDVLTDGNNHASKFTTIQAQAFIDQWEVIDQISNTNTGFSGTLFRSRDTKELVISMRSTKFIDDAVRDSLATNEFEIFNTGFAWGQIRDMEAWYVNLLSGIDSQGNSLTSPDGASLTLTGKDYSVTGYSLGGNLATAFNLLREADGTQVHVKSVITFNGAGVGKVLEGTFTEAVNEFNRLIENPETIKDALGISISYLLDAFDEIRVKFGNAWTVDDAINRIHVANLEYLQDINIFPPGNSVLSPGYRKLERQFISESRMLVNALEEISDLSQELKRIEKLKQGGDIDSTTGPIAVAATDIQGFNLHYRLAIQLMGQKSESTNTILAFKNGKIIDRKLSNQFDVVGDSPISISNAEYPFSAVADSQLHYGEDVRVYIESQPLARGNVLPQFIKQSFKLLVDNYSVNDFGDTHSLVLLVDSLNVQNTMIQLVPESQQATLALSLSGLFKASSNRTITSEIIGSNQGKAEGDVLENVVNSLAELFLGQSQTNRVLKGNRKKLGTDLF